MAAARDQAARVLRSEPDAAENDFGRETSAAPPDPPRAQVSDEVVARRTPELPATAKPAAQAPAVTAAPKSGKRKFVLIGAGLLLALAAASYGVHWILIGRFHVSTDDAYVRANNTMLG